MKVKQGKCKAFMPLITVAMPVCNPGKLLLPAVMSIVNQTYTKWELFIIDDGSNDNSIQTIDFIKDSRIKIMSDGQNLGLARRLNQIIDMSSGKYFARMDQDDISYPNRFACQIEILNNDKSVDLVGVRSITFSTNSDTIGYLPFFEKHNEIISRPWQSIYLTHPTWMGKISWFKKYKYSSPAPYFCEDQELLLRAYPDSKYYSINKILFAYRIKNYLNLKSILKLLRIRYSLFIVKAVIFFKRVQPLKFFLAFLFFLIGIVKDLLLFFHNFFIYIKKPSSIDIKSSTSNIVEFRNVLRLIQKKINNKDKDG